MGSGIGIGCDTCESRNKGIFCDLQQSALKDLGHNKVMTKYKRGQTIFTQGTSPQGIYCVNSGKIKLTKISDEGKESIIRIAGAGDVLGHRSLFSHESYGATATVIEETTICFLNKEYFHKVLLNEPSVSLRLIQKLSQDMGEAESKYAALSQKSVKERLATLLLDLKDDYGTQEADMWKLNIKLTREEMASMIGTAPETIIRFMTELKELGFIHQDGKTIFLHNVDKLKQMAHT